MLKYCRVRCVPQIKMPEELLDACIDREVGEKADEGYAKDMSWEAPGDLIMFLRKAITDFYNLFGIISFITLQPRPKPENNPTARLA